MDDLSNINFDSNENHPILDNLKVNENAILNKSVELPTAEYVAFVQDSTLTEKQLLTSVNNNLKNEVPIISFLKSEDLTEFKKISSEENGVLSAEVLTVKAESNNSYSLVKETSTCAETKNNISFKSVQNDSGHGNNFKSDYCTKSASTCLDEISVGSVNILPDGLSNENFDNNQTKLISSTVQCKETPKQENIAAFSSCVSELENKDDLCMVVPDLLDFSLKEQKNATDDSFGSFSAFETVSSQPENLLNDNLGETCDDPVGFQENLPVSTSTELLEKEYTNKEPKSPAADNTKESATAKVTKNHTIALENTAINNSFLGKSENPGKEFVNYDIAVDNTSVEFEKPCKIANEIFVVDSGKLDALTNSEYVEVKGDNDTAINECDNSPLKVEKVSFGMSNKTFEEFCISADNGFKEIDSDNAGFQVPDNASNFETDAVSPLQIQNVSFGMSNEPLGQFSDADLAFKMPDVQSNKPVEQLSELEVASNNHFKQMSDFAFKTPDVPSNNPLEQLSKPEVPSNSHLKEMSDLDFAFKMPDVPSSNPLGPFSDPDFAFKVPETPYNNVLRNPEFHFKAQENIATNEGDEQFVDAVQFFKDPNSFQFLENIRTSTIQSGCPVPRSSLYLNFDPLHLKFQNASKHDNSALITAAVQGDNASFENCSPEGVKKHLGDIVARESMGNILISFDSPKTSNCMDSTIPVQTPVAPKMITEEEHQQKLKIHELETQEKYIKKQKEMEMQIAKRDELLMIQQMVMEELKEVSAKLSEEIRRRHEKILTLEGENEKLKEDLKTSSEDLQSVENTFTDFYKRYELCKGMLKSLKDNEEQLKQKNLDLLAKAKEQDHMYSMLKERTEEMLEKANVEVDNVKRSGEAQLTVLKAQLKKAEMKISSLESDNKQIKEENNQLGGICDDLMAKVSRS